MNKRILTGIAMGMFLLCVAVSTNASLIISAVGVTSDMGAQTSLTQMTDMSGLWSPSTSSSGYVSGVTDYDTYLADAIHSWFPNTKEWWGLKKTGWIEFDLGNVQNLDGFAIWNEDLNGIKDFTVSTSVDEAIWVDQGAFVAPNTQDPDISPPAAFWYNGQNFDFTTVTVARYVKFNITSIYYSSTSTEHVASIGEVAFAQTSVPEPGTLLLFGVGLAGMAGFRRIKK